MTVTFDLFAFVKFAVIGAAIFVVVLLIWLTLVSLKRLWAARQYDVGDREAMRRRWREIEALLDAPGEMSPKLAVIEADKLLDHALKVLAMPGETLGERLKFATYKYPKLQEVWWAHRVRNSLVHEASYRLDRVIARKAVRTFRETLKMIGAI
ncbi:hypothetical protein KKF05_05990 [Patescibacteria group bacterium]|nr:hypothetical protein [Patescibacteria group bacterium]MBU1028827.1 hypothetical protein [Patescibacteria group bacterium]MBU1916044.1 hypothetical protein [Patescibacteria group bacterium]